MAGTKDIISRPRKAKSLAFNDESLEFLAERTRLTKAQANIAELKEKKLEASQVPIEAVEAIWAAIVIEIRQRIGSCSMADQEKADLLADLQNIPTDEYFKAPIRQPEDDAEPGVEAV